MKLTTTLRIGLLICFCLVLNTNYNHVYAKTRPQWVVKGEGVLNAKRTNETYYFKIIHCNGNELQSLKQNCINTLADYIGKQNHISGEAVTEMKSSNANGSLTEREEFRMTFKNDFSSLAFYAKLVDDYWEYDASVGDAGEYTYYALYAVSSTNQQPDFDHFEVTRSYGIAPVFMSIIPGVGQFYKGQKGKGISMICGGTACAGAIIFCDNQRASYVAKILEQPKHAQTYKTRADNYETARNVAIGLTGALVVWSVIDAAVSPGVTQIKIRKGETLRVKPTAFLLPTGVTIGTSFCYSF